MATEAGDLFKPGVQDENPVRVTPIQDAANAISEKFVVDVGGISQDTLRLNRAYQLSWDPVSLAGKGAAVSYTLLGSVSPFRRENVLQTGLTSPEAIFVPPVFTEVISYYFWVAAVFQDNSSVLLSDTPASLENSLHTTAFETSPITEDCLIAPDGDGMNEELLQVFDYIRSGNKFQLENGGEPALLFLRRHGEDKPYGVPCACTDEDDSDPDYQGRGRCTMCFGTGVFGGYYPSIPVTIRYQGLPGKNFDQAQRGFELDHVFTTYMLWEPVVRTDDLVVRLTDGSRYLVDSRRESSSRGIRLHQDVTLRQVERTHILMQLTDAKIQAALDRAELAGFVRDGFKAFG